MRQKIALLFRRSLQLAIALIAVVLSTNFAVEKTTQKAVYTDVAAVPHNKVGLVLGTGRTLANGRINLYYQYRIEAAVELFRAGKVDYLLLSGDNSRKTYDEPSDMQADLIAAGIPEARIYLDYAGFRTLDSVVRSQAIFGQQAVTIISQPFHLERAIFIGQRKGLNPVGYTAKDVSYDYGWKISLREKLARVKMLLDLAVGKGPKFLGPTVEIK